MRPKNNPKPGDVISVDPIKDVKDIKSIKRMLSDNPRDYALFTVGINTALRASDLLGLTVKDVKAILRDNDGSYVRESKTGKKRQIIFNDAARDALRKLLSMRDYDDAEPIFQGQRGRISESYLCRLVKKWCKDIHLDGHYGSHTLRKSFGYHQRVTFGVDIPTLMQIYGHATQRQTLTYLCVQPEEIKSVYNNVL